MPRRTRTQHQIVGAREAIAIAASLGGVVRTARKARRWTLQILARKVGLAPSRVSDLERGRGARAPLETWISIGIALGRPLAVAFSKELIADGAPIGAGHLQIQEHILGLARATGRPGTFELPTRPDDPSRSTDVGIRDSSNRVRILVECWNTFGDLGAAIRATHRKQHEAAATWPDDRVATVWVVRASAANRALLARYPHIVDAAFPGSSRAWVTALTTGAPPPNDPGLVWFDPGTERLIERRSLPSHRRPTGRPG